MHLLHNKAHQSPCRYGFARWAHLLMCLGALVMVGIAVRVPADVIYNPSNGHYYEDVFVTGGLTWDDARAAAQTRTYQGVTGHLVSITSADETQFLVFNIPSIAADAEHWIGGYQDVTAPDYSEPAGGWRWVSGEPFTYTNWNAGEPNNAGGFPPFEDVMIIRPDGRWNDVPRSLMIGGYIVEYDTPLVNGVSILDLIPDPVKGGKKVKGQVTLDRAAGPGGVVVTLSSDNPAVASPTVTTVTIPEGKISATFTVTTNKVKTDTNVTITATANGDSLSRILFVQH